MTLQEAEAKAKEGTEEKPGPGEAGSGNVKDVKDGQVDHGHGEKVEGATGHSESEGPREKPMSLKDEAKLDIESEEMERKASAPQGAASGSVAEQGPSETEKVKDLKDDKDVKDTKDVKDGKDVKEDKLSKSQASPTPQSPLIKRTSSIDEEVVDYEISDSEEDLSVKTVESVDLSNKSASAAKERRQKSKSRERPSKASSNWEYSSRSLCHGPSLDIILDRYS